MSLNKELRAGPYALDSVQLGSGVDDRIVVERRQSGILLVLVQMQHHGTQELRLHANEAAALRRALGLMLGEVKE